MPTQTEDRLGQLTFYLRDQPIPTPANQPNYQGRPLVCVVAEEVDPPEPPPLPEWADPETENPAFWFHFCISSCSPQDLQPKRFRRPTDLDFGKANGRQIALDRLKKRRTVAHHSLHSPYLKEPKEWTTQVGLTVPVYSSNLREGRIGSLVQRIILAYLADPTYQFPPTARELAQRWFKSPASAQSDDRTEGAGDWIGRPEGESGGAGETA